MRIEKSKYYDDKFYEVVTRSAIQSGEILIPIIQEVFKITSVLDVGCGQGGWLKSWLNNNVDNIYGIDGNYVDLNKLAVPREYFYPADLSRPLNLNKQFDLVQSLEVAEHIGENYDDVFIDNIVRHGKLVMFSAAYPGDGGADHINEKPFSYWQKKFLDRGYFMYDYVRPKLKNNKEIEYWYRYNTFLYIHNSITHTLPQAIKSLEIKDNQAIPLVSPFGYRVRSKIISKLSVSLITRLARLKTLLLILKHKF